MGTIDPSEELLRRRRAFASRRSLSEYAVSLPNQPSDVLGVHPKDDQFRFFKKGRDFQPRKAKHEFTEEEMRVLETYESASLQPSHSEVYRKWLENESPRSVVEGWTILCLVAVITGSLAFLLRFVCERFQIIHIPIVNESLEHANIYHFWMYYTLVSCGFSAMSAITVIYFCPYAAGSGLPEIIGILNGCVVRNVLSFRTLVCKMISAIFVVISKLPVGFEGPMIHIGGMVGACMAKPVRCCEEKSHQPCCGRRGDEGHGERCCCSFPSCAVGLELRNVCRYRDCEERYSLICVGAASGVAAAFSSPISGLTFAMEEISTHWSREQTWRTFVCCVLARTTAELLQSLQSTLTQVFDGVEIRYFDLPESALFDLKGSLNLNLLMFIPACLIGVMGGLVGALVIFIQLKVAKLRRRIFSHIHSPQALNVVKLLEVLLIAVICATFLVCILPAFPCKSISGHVQEPLYGGRKSLALISYHCNHPLNTTTLDNGNIKQSGEFNEGASLFLGTWEQLISNLLSRKTPEFFNIRLMSICLVFFCIFPCWTSMANVSCGLLIPQLATGALYGRILGEVLHSSLQDFAKLHPNVGWEWLDPGAFALMGAASFLSGTSRLPITSVVMIAEMTNDVNMCIVIMICVAISKFVGDLFTHPLYHSMLEIKCIPFLEPELTIYDDEGKKVNLELFTAATVMQADVRIVRLKESVRLLANLLLDTNHGAFPVVSNDEGMERTYLGIISRLELTILLTKTENFDPKEIEQEDMDRLRISYPEYSSTKLKNAETANMVLNKYSNSMVYKNIFVNLQPYVNVSAPSVPHNFCLRRTYVMFTALGIRHLIVTDRLNQVVGIITRKDIMGFSVEAKVRDILCHRNKSFTSSPSRTPPGHHTRCHIGIGIQPSAGAIVEEDGTEVGWGEDSHGSEEDGESEVIQKEHKM